MPVSRRERPAKPALSREAIVDAAFKILDKDGIEKLTMRRLAAELDTGPASLYVYVRSTTELHAFLIDRLLAGLDLTWTSDEDENVNDAWRERLQKLLADYSDLLMQHPGLARSAVWTWPRGKNYLDLVEVILRLLTAGGIPLERAAVGVDILLQQATAMAAEHGTRAAEGDQDLAEQTEALHGADPARHPLIARLGLGGMTAGEPGARRAWAFEVTITGLQKTAPGT